MQSATTLKQTCVRGFRKGGQGGASEEGGVSFQELNLEGSVGTQEKGYFCKEKQIISF